MCRPISGAWRRSSCNGSAWPSSAPIVGFISLGSIGRWFDKKAVLLGTFSLLMIDGIGVIGLRLLHALPANGSPALLVILVANEIVRTWLATLLGIIFVSMLADTIDVQELNTGRRQEGVFAAALAFSGKATAGVGAVIAGFLLQQVVRWPRQVDPHHIDPEVVTRLGLVAGVLVPLLLALPLALGSRYSITRHKHMLTRQELDRRRAQPRQASAGGRAISIWRWRSRPPGYLADLATPPLSRRVQRPSAACGAGRRSCCRPGRADRRGRACPRCLRARQGDPRSTSRQRRGRPRARRQPCSGDLAAKPMVPPLGAVAGSPSIGLETEKMPVGVK